MTGDDDGIRTLPHLDGFQKQPTLENGAEIVLLIGSQPGRVGLRIGILARGETVEQWLTPMLPLTLDQARDFCERMQANILIARSKQS